MTVFKVFSNADNENTKATVVSEPTDEVVTNVSADVIAEEVATSETKNKEE